MGHTIAIHAYRGGSGKSHLCANLAYQAALLGHRVALLDLDLAAPGLHLIFHQEPQSPQKNLHDVLTGGCEITAAAMDVGSSLAMGTRGGTLHLLPGKLELEPILNMLREGLDVARLTTQLGLLVDALELDLVFLDTPPGFTQESALLCALAETLLISVRPDSQDLRGTAVLLELVATLAIPRVQLVANQVPAHLEAAQLAAKMQEALGYEVLGVLPYSETLMALASRDLFSALKPADPLSQELARLAARVTDPGSFHHFPKH